MNDSNTASCVEVLHDARGVARVTLRRPEKHNAFDDGVIGELLKVFSAIAGEEKTRAVILASEGRSFSAGADLAWMQRMMDYDYERNREDAGQLALLFETLRKLPQPTIARIQGNAFGGALGLICCCDIAIAGDAASFALSEARIGLIPATIAPYVIEAIGSRWARRLFVSAERIDATQAEAIGLIHERCDAAELDARVDAVVDGLLLNSPAAVRAAKELVSDLHGKRISEDVIADTSSRIARIRVSEEGQEGLRAFLDKRRPTWVEEEAH